jgi:integrase
MMLSDFETHLHARRRAANTIRIRMIYLRQLESQYELATATTRDLEAILVSHPEWKPETVNAAIGSWSVFYKWALRNGKVSADPTEDLERAYVGRVVKTLADDDRIREALERATDAEAAMLLLGREAGLRRMEIATLRIEHRSAEWLTVTGKGGRRRRIHLTQRLRATLSALERGQAGYYFPGEADGHIAAEVVARKVFGLIGTSTHSLRRRAITSVYRNSGGNIRIAQEFAGHARVDTTAVYVEVNEGDMIAAGGYVALAA